MNKKSKNWKNLFSKNFILGSGIVLKIRDKNLSVGNAYKMMDEFLQAGLSRYEEHLAKKGNINKEIHELIQEYADNDQLCNAHKSWIAEALAEDISRLLAQKREKVLGEGWAIVSHNGRLMQIDTSKVVICNSDYFKVSDANLFKIKPVSIVERGNNGHKNRYTKFN